MRNRDCGSPGLRHTTTHENRATTTSFDYNHDFEYDVMSERPFEFTSNAIRIILSRCRNIGGMLLESKKDNKTNRDQVPRRDYNVGLGESDEGEFQTFFRESEPCDESCASFLEDYSLGWVMV